MQNLRIGALAIVATLVVGANLSALATSSEPFTTGNSVFDVKKYVADSEWIENAPIVLTSQFKNVRLVNVKSDFNKSAVANEVEGFSVQQEIIDIFGGVEADYSEYPLDYRATTTLLTPDNLKPFAHRLPWGSFDTEVHCVPAVAKDCSLAMFWDKSTVRRQKLTTFIAVRLRGNTFALVEKQLFDQLNVVKPVA